MSRRTRGSAIAVILRLSVVVLANVRGPRPGIFGGGDDGDICRLWWCLLLLLSFVGGATNAWARCGADAMDDPRRAEPDARHVGKGCAKARCAPRSHRILARDAAKGFLHGSQYSRG